MPLVSDGRYSPVLKVLADFLRTNRGLPKQDHQLSGPDRGSEHTDQGQGKPLLQLGVHPMSKSTILATGRIAGAEVITITYIQPADAPSMIMLRWPGQPSVTTPDRLPAVANAVMAVMAEAIAKTGPDFGRREDEQLR